MIRENKQDSRRSDCPSPHLAASCHPSGSAQFSELHVLAQITSCQHPSRIRGCQAVSTYDVDSESLVVPFPSGNGLLLGVFPWLANTASSVQNNSKAHSVTALIAVIIKKQKTRLNTRGVSISTELPCCLSRRTSLTTSCTCKAIPTVPNSNLSR